MKYIMAFIWSFLLVTMLNYVAGSIAGVPAFNFMGGVVAAVVMAIIILCITAITPEGEVADH
ncbi:DUF2929 family protein [Sporosarcina koreensis]|uniref:DUF2929 family protein n=1 Tax=Sporosarcina koreensis TaxID=334735 RepID=A0ABW0U006_9BACL